MVQMLVELLTNKACHVGSFHLMVLLKAHHNDESPRVRRDDDENVHESLESSIRRYVSGRVPKHPKILCSPPQQTSSWTRSSSTLFDNDFVRRIGPCEARRISWEFPWASRTLRERYLRLMNERGCHCRVNDRCFHTLDVHHLGWLQLKAWSETRCRIFCTIGTSLPTELTERIFEHVLGAEEVPESPSVMRKEDNGAAQKWVASGCVQSRGRYDPRTKLVKNMYRCIKMERNIDNMV